MGRAARARTAVSVGLDQLAESRPRLRKAVEHWRGLKRRLPVEPAYLLGENPGRWLRRRAFGYRLMWIGTLLFVPVPLMVVAPLSVLLKLSDGEAQGAISWTATAGTVIILAGFAVKEFAGDVQIKFRSRREPVE